MYKLKTFFKHKNGGPLWLRSTLRKRTTITALRGKYQVINNIIMIKVIYDGIIYPIGTGVTDEDMRRELICPSGEVIE